MKKITTIILLVLIAFCLKAQDDQKNTAKNVYTLKYATKAYYKVKTKKDTLKKGWIINEEIGRKNISRILEEDVVIVSKKDTSVIFSKNWKISEVKHTDKEPDKLYINPYIFKNRKDLNTKMYIKIPENGFATLRRRYVKWSAITIPFALRPALNDTIGSKVTTDLKIGASISYNWNKQIYKNRRIKAAKSIRGLSTGIGFGFSKVTLDENSTSLLEKPYENEEDGLAFFIAPGIGLNLKGFQVSAFLGWDVGVTDNVSDWNYNKELYLGLGLGIDINTIGK